MKKSLIVLAVLGAFAGVASAQSSVTLFGIMDAAATNVKNGSASIQSLASGGNSSSRWGIRGTEALSADLSAGFWLESSVAADTGASSAGFDRRSTVSLASASAGELRLGRDYVPTYSLWVAKDPFGYVGVASSSAMLGNVAQAVSVSGVSSTVRANNMVEYFLPTNLGGVYGSLQASAGEGAAPAAATKGMGGRLGYAAGPVDVQVALYNSKNTSPAGSPTFKDLAIGASYDFGVVKLNLARRTFKIAAEKITDTMLSATAPVGPGTVKFSYIKANQAGSVSNNDGTLLGAGYVYDLSKRTALYGTVARISNKGNAQFAIAGGPAIAGGQKSTGYQFGVRHNF